MIVSLQEIKEHLKIEYNEEDSYLQILILAAEKFIQNATGKTFKSNQLAKVICMIIVADLFENKGMTVDKIGESTRGIVGMMLTQLNYHDKDSEDEAGEAS
ncbi:head-tail connector protein [Natronincola ferrireducens]|uniref:Uncharacterized phage protein (Possible DNA packaging) n=1 Tax=Natronincola ferrireducens TaxID=393762 RepID=A0A1G9I5I5_9FIRM|nr:head-tail connector protein [Natronincola ferrireducens]SDL20362.1 uncharacterized phage protein (possible DNA packaging) [Natronincola ferrireducens]